MICFLQPNPKVINVLLHSASSPFSSANQTFIPEVLHTSSCLNMDFLPLEKVDYLCCTWYLNGEHCKTDVLTGLFIFYFSALFSYLSPSVVFPLAWYWCILLFLPPQSCKLLECKVPSYPFVGDDFTKSLHPGAM